MLHSNNLALQISLIIFISFLVLSVRELSALFKITLILYTLYIVIFNPFLALLLLFIFAAFDRILLAEGFTIGKGLGILVGAGLLMNIAQRKIEFKLNNKIIFMFLLVSLSALSITYSRSVEAAKWETISLLLGTGFAIAVQHLVNTEDKLRKSLTLLLVGGFLSCFPPVLGLEKAGFFSYAITLEGRVGGAVGDPNEFAALLIALLPLALVRSSRSRGVSKYIYTLLSASFILGIIASVSRSAYLSTFLILLMLFLFSRYITHKRKMVLTYFIVFFLVIIVIGILAERYLPLIEFRIRNITSPVFRLRHESYLNRVAIYQVSWRMFLNYPLLGLGARNFIFNLPEYGLPPYFCAHNMYIEILTGLGLIGFMLFMLIILKSERSFRCALESTLLTPDQKSELLALYIGFIMYLLLGFLFSLEREKIFWVLIGLSGAVANIYNTDKQNNKRQIKSNVSNLTEN